MERKQEWIKGVTYMVTERFDFLVNTKQYTGNVSYNCTLEIIYNFIN